MESKLVLPNAMSLDDVTVITGTITSLDYVLNTAKITFTDATCANTYGLSEDNDIEFLYNCQTNFTSTSASAFEIGDLVYTIYYKEDDEYKQKIIGHLNKEITPFCSYDIIYISSTERREGSGYLRKALLFNVGQAAVVNPSDYGEEYDELTFPVDYDDALFLQFLTEFDLSSTTHSEGGVTVPDGSIDKIWTASPHVGFCVNDETTVSGGNTSHGPVVKPLDVDAYYTGGDFDYGYLLHETAYDYYLQSFSYLGFYDSSWLTCPQRARETNAITNESSPYNDIIYHFAFSDIISGDATASSNLYADEFNFNSSEPCIGGAFLLNFDHIAAASIENVSNPVIALRVSRVCNEYLNIDNNEFGVITSYEWTRTETYSYVFHDQGEETPSTRIARILAGDAHGTLPLSDANTASVIAARDASGINTYYFYNEVWNTEVICPPLYGRSGVYFPIIVLFEHLAYLVLLNEQLYEIAGTIVNDPTERYPTPIIRPTCSLYKDIIRKEDVVGTTGSGEPITEERTGPLGADECLNAPPNDTLDDAFAAAMASVISSAGTNNVYLTYRIYQEKVPLV